MPEVLALAIRRSLSVYPRHTKLSTGSPRVRQSVSGDHTGSMRPRLGRVLQAHPTLSLRVCRSDCTSDEGAHIVGFAIDDNGGVGSTLGVESG